MIRDSADLQARINTLVKKERTYEIEATGSFLGGVALTSVGILGAFEGDLKTAIGLGLGSLFAYAFALANGQAKESASEQIATYEAAQYITQSSISERKEPSS